MKLKKFKEGDKVEMEILGLGKGIVEIKIHEGKLQLYNEHGIYYPLLEALSRKDMILKHITNPLPPSK